MTRERSGPQMDDIFRKSGEIGKSDPKQKIKSTYTEERPGQPIPRSRTTIYMYNRQILSLDQFSMDIRGRSGAIISRAEIIRGVLDAFLESGGDFSHVQSEYELKEAVLERLEG